jgi:hypothetical protein
MGLSRTDKAINLLYFWQIMQRAVHARFLEDAGVHKNAF